MKPFLKIFVLIALASLLAAISKYFVHGWYNIIPWVIATLLVGFLAQSRKRYIINGAVFGYFLFFIYIILAYSGKTDPMSLVKFIAFAVIFSLVGSLAGIAGSFIGNFIRRKFIIYTPV
jgi:hypothetical protein